MPNTAVLLATIPFFSYGDMTYLTSV